MPRTAGVSVPKYSKHKASGQAVVTVGGVDHYLGPHGTKASLIEYDRLIAEWMANGRQVHVTAADGLTVAELLGKYRRFAESYYRKNGRITNEVTAIASAAKIVRQLYGNEPASTFGPLKLQAVQQAMIRADWVRKHINKQVGRIVRIFSWAVAQELVKADVAHALREVKGLHQGRSAARETPPVLPVSDAIVDATLPYLPAIVADIVRFQRFTGCRPQEACLVRPCDVDTSGEVWVYVPAEHKTEHHGKRRTIFIGPRAQDVLRPYLLREKESYCFVPADSERKRRAELTAARRIPVSYGNRPGTNCKRDPKRSAGERYTTDSYRRAIDRACDKAFPAPANATPEAAREWKLQHRWAPNRLRHTAATELRKRFGLEAAQVVLGHSAADVTQIYAERDLAKAAAVIREVG
jgi:integrase